MSSSNPIAASGGAAADFGHGQSAPNSPSGHGATGGGRDDRQDQDHADFRLTIEEDETPGSPPTLIYKTIDRRSGEVVSTLPDDQVRRMGEASDYVAGAVIKTSA